MVLMRGGLLGGAEKRETRCCCSSVQIAGLVGYGGGDGDVI